MSGYTKTFTLDFTSSGDTVYTGTDKLEDNEDSIIGWLNTIKKNYASATAPTLPAPDEGQFWWDSTNDLLYIYTGAAWLLIGVATYKVKNDSGDTTEGYLDAKVQKSITANATDHKMELSGDSASPGNYYFYSTNSGGTKGWNTIPAAAVPSTGYVLVSSDDTTKGYLNGKLTAGTAITLTEGSGGGNETLSVGVTASSIGTSQLKVSSGAVSTTSSEHEDLILPGGAYGFYPQLKSSSSGVYAYWGTYNEPADMWAGRTQSTTYVTTITLNSYLGAAIAYAQQTYITSSGDIFWIFLLIDKSTGEIVASFQSPEHVCFNNGSDPLLVPHPFGDYDETKHEIIVVNPTQEQLAEMDGLCASPGIGFPEKDILELFYPTKDNEGKITADPIYTLDTIEMEYPKSKTAIGALGANNRSMRPTIWRKGLLELDHPVMKMKIPQPEYVKVRGLKKNY